MTNLKFQNDTFGPRTTALDRLCGPCPSHDILQATLSEPR
jgi:hypothetical protein